MKRYTIKGKRLYAETVTFTVEANSEEEAFEMIESGEVGDNNDPTEKELYIGDDLEVVVTEFLHDDTHHELGGSE